MIADTSHRSCWLGGFLVLDSNSFSVWFLGVVQREKEDTNFDALVPCAAFSFFFMFRALVMRDFVEERALLADAPQFGLRVVSPGVF